MGSPLRLTVVGIPADRAAAAWATVSNRIEGIEQALSRFRETSDLVALNRRAGDPTVGPVPRDLMSALVAAHRAWRITGGTFDPRVLLDLERLGYRGASIGPGDPGGAAASRATGPAGFPEDGWLIGDPRRSVAAVAAPIDLGGIGKGLALRWALRALEQDLPEALTGSIEAESGSATVGALLEAGGDIAARGAAPQPGPWLVSIEHPVRGAEVAVLEASGGAVCTSSVAVHTWKTGDGRDVHHLVDPLTGEPGGVGIASVTVAHVDPAWAEVWSKSLFLAGVRGIGILARRRGLAAWWFDADGTLEMTPAARVQTVWVDGEP